MSVLQFPCSATPVCSRPSHLWTASDSLWSVHPGRSVCPAELWARKVRGASSHWTKFKWIKTEKKNRERRFQAQSEMSQRVAFLYESLPNWFCFWWTQETSVWCCTRRAAFCPPCVESRVKNTPWDSTSPSSMNAATHTCATELQSLLRPTGLAHYSHCLFHTQSGE